MRHRPPEAAIALAYSAPTTRSQTGSIVSRRSIARRPTRRRTDLLVRRWASRESRFTKAITCFRLTIRQWTAAKNLLSYFENTVGRPTKITVSASADGANARTYTVFPALGENRLRRAN